MAFYHGKRGCGLKVAGGFYLEGGIPTAGGHLYSVTAAFGTMTLDGHNVVFGDEIPKRGVAAANLWMTLTKGEYVQASEPSDDSASHLAGRVPEKGILDYVGSDNYSPIGFITEVAMHGPSRRVTEEIARQMASVMRGGSVPVLFCMKTPMFATVEQRDAAVDLWAEKYGYRMDGLYSGPAWEHPKWGARLPHEHLMGPREERPEHYGTSMLDTIETYGIGGLHTRIATIVISWFTRVSYVAADLDDDRKLGGLDEAGIKVLTPDDIANGG